MHAIFEHYPALRDALPVFRIGDFPTPVTEAGALARETGCGRLFIKRDDQSAARYGGNKVRKLEWLLGEAQRRGCRKVLTYGFAGSNHCLATALYAREAGLGCIAMLLPQPNATPLQRNLLLGHAAGASLHEHGGMASIALGTIAQWLRCTLTTGKPPMVIPPGGSSPLGAVGFVDAAFELARQVDEGLLPRPDIVYTAMGSTGTTAGLHVGFRVLGWPTRIAAIRVTEEAHANAAKTEKLIRDTAALLRKHTPDFPHIEPDMDAIDIRGEYFGEGYGVYSPEGMAARDTLAGALGGVKLDGTYAAKASAALLEDGIRGVLTDKSVVFWNTYNSNDMSGMLDGLDYRALPKRLHRYFETPVQALDEAVGKGGDAAG